MPDKPLNERTVKEIVESFLAADDVEPGDKLWMFVQLINDKPLMQQLESHNLSLTVGIAIPDPIYDFAYGVLRLAKPHLFDND